MSPARVVLHVLDGTAALFRAFYGMPSRKGPDGVEIGAVVGLEQWLRRYRDAMLPTHAAIVFDTAERTFRHDIASAYKANRKPPPDELVPQFARALDAVTAAGFRAFRVPGFEADDLVATLVHRARAASIDVVMVSPDKDVLQLLGPGVSAVDPKNFAPITDADVVARFGVPASLLADLQALAGDPTDGISGVPGIGPKAAAALLTSFGSFDAIFAEPERAATLPIRGAKGLPEKLRAGRDLAFLCRRLVTLRADAPLAAEAMTLRDLRVRDQI